MINKKTSTSYKKIAISLCVVTALMMIVNVSMSARVAKDGLMIDLLSKRQQELKAEIRDLDREVITQTSLNDLSNKAKSLGYAAPTSVINLSVNAPIAYNR